MVWNWIASLIGANSGKIVDNVSNAIDSMCLTDEEKQKFKIEMESLLQKRDSELEQTLRAEIESKERVLVAELNQSDVYTKRARPTLVYFGLFVIFFNYCFVPLLQYFKGVTTIIPFELPTEFWWAWGGVVGTWSLGRSAERVGFRNRVIDTVVGNVQPPIKSKKPSILD